MMTKITKDDLLRVADAFRAITGMEDAGMSWRAFGESKKLGLLRGDADITLGRFNTAMAWFAANWPEGSDLPPALRPYLSPDPDAKTREAAA
jgi:hypothetical protein